MLKWTNTRFKVTSRDCHDDVIKWEHFPCYWPFVRGIHRSQEISLHKGQWRGALMFSLIYTWINGWVSNCEAGDLRYHHAHYDVIVMDWSFCITYQSNKVNYPDNRFQCIPVYSLVQRQLFKILAFNIEWRIDIHCIIHYIFKMMFCSSKIWTIIFTLCITTLNDWFIIAFLLLNCFLTES